MFFVDSKSKEARECTVSWRNARQYNYVEGQKNFAAARSFSLKAFFLGLLWPEKGQKVPKMGRRPK